MRHYQQYTAEDFALDAQFRQWVNDPTPEQDHVWEQWLNEFPDKRPTVEQARIMVVSLQIQEPVEIDEASIQQEIHKILSLTQEKAPATEKAPETIRFHPYRTLFVRVAASVALILGISWWYWQYQPFHKQPAGETTAIQAETAPARIEQINRGSKPMLVNLPDKSTVLLQKNSRIHYSSVFNGSSREVYLEGEAFFEVAKDRQRPFFVYTSEIVTRVVGTSFHVKANPSENNISVLVKTGRVAVFTQAGHPEISATDSSEVVLTPNEQLIYQKKDKQLKQLAVQPIEIRRLAIPESRFEFHQTPVQEVFTRLEENYNVDIQYTAAQLQNCDLTASFTDEPFAVKLDLICGAIGVSYRIEENRVIIQGNGCAQ